MLWASAHPWAALVAALSFRHPTSYVISPANPGLPFLVRMPVSEAGWAAFCSTPTEELGLLIAASLEAGYASAALGDLREASLEDLIYHHRMRLGVASSFAAWAWLAPFFDLSGTPPYQGGACEARFYQRAVLFGGWLALKWPFLNINDFGGRACALRRPLPWFYAHPLCTPSSYARCSPWWATYPLGKPGGWGPLVGPPRPHPTPCLALLCAFLVRPRSTPCLSVRSAFFFAHTTFVLSPT